MEADATFWGPLAGVAASAGWALGVVAYSSLSQKYPPYIVNLLRVLIGLPFFLLILFFQHGVVETWHLMWGLEQSRYVWLLVGVISSYALGDVLFFESARRLGGTSALAIASVYPVWSAVAGWVFKGDAFHFAQGLGVLAVVAGTVTVILASGPMKSVEQAERSQRRKFWIGVTLGFLASVAWATNTYSVSKAGANLSPVLSNAVRLSMAVLLAPVFGMLLMGRRSFKMISWQDFRPFAFFFFVEALFGPFLYIYSLTHSPLAVGAVLTSLAPVMTVPAAVFMKTEKFSWRKLVGVLLVVSGIWALLIL